MNRSIFFVLVAIGVALGIWHLRLALSAIFMFREGEPLSSWLFVVFGPGSTLPCTLVAAWRPTLGGSMLVGLATASAIVLAVAMRSAGDVMLAEAETIMLPMLLLGAAFVGYGRRSQSLRSVVPNITTGA